MNKYYKEIEGKKVFYKNGAPVSYNGRTYISPKEEHILAAGWLKYIEPAPIVEEKTLKQVVADKITQINNYDNSSYINRCSIVFNNTAYDYWADKNTRASLKNAIEAYKNAGNTKYTLDLRNENISLTIDCDVLINMLNTLEVYAIECYNVTSRHIYAVNALTDIEDVQNYNYKIDYPKIITFNINEQ